MSYIDTLKLNNVNYKNTDTSCTVVKTNDNIIKNFNRNYILDIDDPEVDNLFKQNEGYKFMIKDNENNIKQFMLKQENIPNRCQYGNPNYPCNYSKEVQEVINNFEEKNNELLSNIKENEKKILEKTKMFVKTNRQIEDIDFYNNPYNYDNTNFWNSPFDYDNKIDDKGNILKLKGVCNPLLFDNCNNINSKDEIPMNGICKGQNIFTNNNINLQTNNNSNYKNIYNYDNNLFIKNTTSNNNYSKFNYDNNLDSSYKLSKGTLINNNILNIDNFALEYCQSGEYTELNNKFFCN